MMTEIDFANDASVTFMPTMSGATGPEQIQQFFARHSRTLPFIFPFLSNGTSNVAEFEVVSEKPAVRSAEVGVEERLVRFQFSESVEWMLPGLEPSNSPVEVAICVLTQYANQDGLVKVKSVRVYWDQSVVLRQLGFIEPVVSVPVLTAQQVRERYCDEHVDSRSVDPLVYQLSAQIQDEPVPVIAAAAPVVSSVKKQQGRQSMGDLLAGGNNNGEEYVRPSTRLNSKYVGGRSQISLGDDYSNNAAGFDSEQVRHHHVDKRRYETHFQIGQQPEQQQNVHYQKSPVKGAKGKQHYPGSNESHWQFGSDVDGDMSVNQRPSSRVLNVPGGKSTLQLF